MMNEVNPNPRVAWGAIWIGALTALAIGLIFGLLGTAAGAYKINTRGTADFGFWTLVFSVCGSFFAFVGGAWVTAKLSGFRDAESSIIHGAIVWLLTIPVFLFFAALGAGAYFGGWYSGLAGTPAWVTSVPVTDAHAAAVARNSALGAVTALLIGLVGSVIGGWMASGQPMTIWQRRVVEPPKVRRVGT
jgi:hypothetical protein